MGKKGEWALIHSVVLQPGKRAIQVPPDTRAVPLELWVKGRLTTDAEVGSEVSVITRTGRTAAGTLVAVNPRYTHDYGDFIPELLDIGDAVRELLFGGGPHEGQ